MPSPTQTMVRALLREAGPLTADELLTRVPDWRPPRSKNRKEALRNAIANDRLCENRGDGRYVYLPRFLDGAGVFVPVVAGDGSPRRLAVGVEVEALLWPGGEEAASAPPRLALPGGPTVDLGLLPGHGIGGTSWEGQARSVEPEPPFWGWWDAQRQEGADAIVVTCEEHEAGRFTACAVQAEERDRDAVRESNERLLETARQVMKATEGMPPVDLARRLLARGVYHHAPPPDPLIPVLLAPPSQFVIDMGYRLVYRPELTPALRRLFADRIEFERAGGVFNSLFGTADTDTDENDEWDVAEDEDEVAARKEDEEDEESAGPRRDVPPPANAYRIKVGLHGDKKVWRTIEILDNQTLEDLHDAIQDGFGWDDDHLYAFYLSGRFGDQLTEVGRPTGEEWDEPPTADEVLLADLELAPGQRLAYRFDFGAQLDHVLDVTDVLAAPAAGTFPRLVASQGEAPPQESFGDHPGLIVVWDVLFGGDEGNGEGARL